MRYSPLAVCDVVLVLASYIFLMCTRFLFVFSIISHENMIQISENYPAKLYSLCNIRITNW